MPTGHGKNDPAVGRDVPGDGQGQRPDTGTFSVTIVDDVPQANDDGPVAVAEDTRLIITALANDLSGAEGSVWRRALR